MDFESEFFNSFRLFCEREIEPNSSNWDELGEFPISIFKSLSNIGYFGLLAEEEDGGSNLGVLVGTKAMELLSEYSGSVFFSVSASFGFIRRTTETFWYKRTKKKTILSTSDQRR
jgi:alkylation response protein AidB-like acyl-CoA dehydrogenase